MIHRSIWIARDEAIMDVQEQNHVERYPEDEYIYGQLHIFYEKPCEKRNGIWIGARDMDHKASNYMFPEIKCGMCVEFKGEIITEEEHDRT